MLLTEEYIKLPQMERQKHLDLDSPCVERGGNSTVHKGILAQFLDTDIPKKGIDLCHACHNGACSSPYHLYFGTRKENVQDSKDNGTHHNAFDSCVQKYGYEKACKMNAHYGNTNAAKMPG